MESIEMVFFFYFNYYITVHTMYMYVHIFSTPVSAVFGRTHPDYVSFLYLVAPVSLVILNPLGFSLLEKQRYRSIAPDLRLSACSVLLTVVRGVLLNLIVFMSVLGIAGNFIFSQHVSKVFDQLLIMLGR